MKKPMPLTQGDVTGECVIYSALNAVRWLWPEHFGEIEACEKLYGELVSRMKTEGLKDMLIEGTESDAALTVAWRMADLMEARGLCLRCEAPISKYEWKAAVDRGFADTKMFMERVSKLLRRRLGIYTATAAVIGLDEPWNHWTMVHKITDKSVLFYDSYGPARLTRLPRADFVTGIDRADEAIQIDAPATIIYRRLDPPQPIMCPFDPRVA